MLDSIIFCSTLALRDSLHSLLCRYTLFLSCTPTFVNWALPANKLRVMCRVFIKNMLEKHTPIKDSVFYAERGAEHRVWEEEPSEAAAPLPSVAEFVRLLWATSPQVWVWAVPLLHLSVGLLLPGGLLGSQTRWCQTRRTAPQPGDVCTRRASSSAALAI